LPYWNAKVKARVAAGQVADVHLAESGLHNFLRPLPDFERVVLDPSRARQYLLVCELMTPDLAAAGQFLAAVGVAPTIPAEFVVVRIGRVHDALEVTEPQEVAAWQ